MSIFKRTKELKKGSLSNIEVDLISLLFDDVKPCNQKGVIVKSITEDDSSEGFVFRGSSNKVKSDKQGYLYVTVMIPDKKDSQGDFTTKEEIQKACDRFAQGGMILRNDVNHNMQAIPECFVAENYILKTEDKEHYPDSPVGSWVQKIKFNDLNSELWKKVVAGNINGVSLYGRALDDNSSIEVTTKAELTKTINYLKSINDESSKKIAAQLEEKVKTLDEAIKSNTNEKQIKSIEKGIQSLLNTLNKALNTQLPGEPDSTVITKDKEITIGDAKVIMKSEKIELYKALGSVDSGTQINVLNDNLGSQFVDTVVDFSPDDVFTDISVVELNKDEEIDKGIIEDIVLKNAKDGKPSDNAVGEFDLKCPTEILKGVLKLKQETVEFYRDKKGDAEFGAYVEQKLREKIQKALKKLLFNGDRTSTDDSLKGLDGVLVKMKDKAEHFKISKTDKTTLAEVLSNGLKSFSNDALSELSNFQIYCSPKTLLDIQDEYAKRQTAVGDKFLITNDEVTYKGMKIKPRHLPDNEFVMGIMKFIILGYRTDVTVKIEHSGDEWVWRWFVRVRFGTQYISGGLVKRIEITSTTTP
jgi:hypothetical protein